MSNNENQRNINDALINQSVIDLLLKNHSTVFSAYKANLTAAHPMVAFYQGQYSKAVIKWQEQAIFGNDIQKNLFRISDLFCELGCILELAIFVSWTVSNFDKMVSILLARSEKMSNLPTENSETKPKE